MLYFKCLNYNRVNNVPKLFRDFGCKNKDEDNAREKYCVPCWNEEYNNEEYNNEEYNKEEYNKEEYNNEEYNKEFEMRRI